MLGGLGAAEFGRGFIWVWSSAAYSSGFITWHQREILASDGGNLVNPPGDPWTR